MDKKLFNMFMWVADVRYIQDDKGQIFLEEKPQLSFEYDSIRYLLAEQVYKTSETSDDIQLSQEQQNEIDQFIIQKREEVGILKLAVDSAGKFIGLVRESDDRIAKIVDNMPPTQDDWIWDFEIDNWVKAYHYDMDGNFVRETSGNSVGFTKKPYPSNKNPIIFKYDSTIGDWIIDNNLKELFVIVRNKIIFDSLLEYIRINLIYNIDSQVEQLDYKYLQEIVSRITNMQSWREMNVIDSNKLLTLNNLDDDFIQLMQIINNTDKSILEIHDEGLSFQQKIVNLLQDNLYKGNSEIIDQIAIDDFINNV